MGGKPKANRKPGARAAPGPVFAPGVAVSCSRLAGLALAAIHSRRRVLCEFRRRNVTESHTERVLNGSHGVFTGGAVCLYSRRQKPLRTRLNAFSGGVLFLGIEKPPRRSGAAGALCVEFVVIYAELGEAYKTEIIQKRNSGAPLFYKVRVNKFRRFFQLFDNIRVCCNTNVKQFHFLYLHTKPPTAAVVRFSFHKVLTQSPDNPGGKIQDKKQDPKYHFFTPSMRSTRAKTPRANT
jgi:hypothetical protein